MSRIRSWFVDQGFMTSSSRSWFVDQGFMTSSSRSWFVDQGFMTSSSRSWFVDQGFMASGSQAYQGFRPLASVSVIKLEFQLFRHRQARRGCYNGRT